LLIPIESRPPKSEREGGFVAVEDLYLSIPWLENLVEGRVREKWEGLIEGRIDDIVVVSGEAITLDVVERIFKEHGLSGGDEVFCVDSSGQEVAEMRYEQRPLRDHITGSPTALIGGSFVFSTPSMEGNDPETKSFYKDWEKVDLQVQEPWQEQVSSLIFRRVNMEQDMWKLELMIHPVALDSVKER